jgi:hypothetical protein
MCSALRPTATERRELVDTIYDRLARHGMGGLHGWSCAHEIIGTVLDDLRSLSDDAETHHERTSAA